jgi:hypothetical protein
MINWERQYTTTISASKVSAVFVVILTMIGIPVVLIVPTDGWVTVIPGSQHYRTVYI